jgi:hypothetical protein
MTQQRRQPRLRPPKVTSSCLPIACASSFSCHTMRQHVRGVDCAEGLRGVSVRACLGHPIESKMSVQRALQVHVRCFRREGFQPKKPRGSLHFFEDSCWLSSRGEPVQGKALD